MSNTTYSYQLRDQEVIGKIIKVAQARGEKDWRGFARRTFDTALKAALGIEVEMTPKEVAGELGVHRNTVKRYLRAGRFPHAYWINARRVRIPYRDVAALKERTV